ncbi:hypothetical protein Q1695_002541 [Nippostrongylus brasiliensis]|nr:hypothetical protein Q1695_002541 [Nippostrongylus brasiliensis]
MGSHHKCTSQSYCVTLKSRTGLVQRSCDGNTMAHISLCALSPSRRRLTSGGSEFVFGSSGAPSHRSGRQQQLEMNCFNGGELGEVCCCSTDFCNASDSSTRWMALLATFVLLFG